MQKKIWIHLFQKFGPILQHIFLVDPYHIHDLAARKSLTGLLGYVGSTPSTWMSKRQGSIASSIYAAEFTSLCTAIEEVKSICCILRCLGCNLQSDGPCPTCIFGENLSAILNAQNPAADLYKKYVAVSFHIVREAIAAGIMEPYWLNGVFNMSYIMTKQIP